MRYVGQGHEITVAVPPGDLGDTDGASLRDAFAATYEQLYGRSISHLDVEVLVWSLTLSSSVAEPQTAAPVTARAVPSAGEMRRLFDPATRSWSEAPVHARIDLVPGDTVEGPAVIVEDQTTTIVPDDMILQVNGLGYLDLTAKGMRS